MRTIGVVTVARSDYGIYLPVLRRIQADPDLRLHLFVSGMHLSPEFGMTVRLIEEDGFEIGEKIEMLLSSDTPEGIAKSMGLGMIGFAGAFTRQKPDILLVLGDRFEMFAAVAAAVPFTIPVAHLHGGESTEGLIDEAIRHSITKMSHLHFASTEVYGQRIIQMGEDPWRVTVSGAPSLDNLRVIPLFSANEVRGRFGLDAVKPIILVTYHPVTLEHADTTAHVEALLTALDELDAAIVFTYPNADTQGRQIIDAINAFVKTHRNAQAVTNLGTRWYFSIMKVAAAMVGNSSSGIIEAASFRLPVVNIGHRQQGRLHAENVIDTDSTVEAIRAAVLQATSPDFRAGLTNLVNPYGDGSAAEKIVSRLKTVELDSALLVKKFHDNRGD